METQVIPLGNPKSDEVCVEEKSSNHNESVIAYNGNTLEAQHQEVQLETNVGVKFYSYDLKSEKDIPTTVLRGKLNVPDTGPAAQTANDLAVAKAINIFSDHRERTLKSKKLKERLTNCTVG